MPRTSVLFGITLLLSLSTADTVAQPARSAPLWFARVYGFGVRYSKAIAFDPGVGGGVSLGRAVFEDWLSVEMGLEYTRAAQTLSLVTGPQRAFVRITQPFVAACARWRPGPSSPLHLFLHFRMALLYLQPQPVSVETGADGEIELRPPDEVKISPGTGAGISYRFLSHLAAFLQVEGNVLAIEERELDRVSPSRAWKSYAHYEFGLLVSF